MKKNKNLKYWIISLVIIVIVLFVVSFLINTFASLSYIESARIVFGSVYVLFLPGFIISYLFFPKTKSFDCQDKEKGAVDWIERIALSFALSIAIVPLVVFYLNLIGLKISAINSFFSILGIMVISLVILFIKTKIS